MDKKKSKKASGVLIYFNKCTLKMNVKFANEGNTYDYNRHWGSQIDN